MSSLKEHIEGVVTFVKYHDGNLWYRTQNTNFEFPVPIEDIGNASFLAQDKGILFMRHVRKHIKNTQE